MTNLHPTAIVLLASLAFLAGSLSQQFIDPSYSDILTNPGSDSTYMPSLSRQGKFSSLNLPADCRIQLQDHSKLYWSDSDDTSSLSGWSQFKVKFNSMLVQADRIKLYYKELTALEGVVQDRPSKPDLPEKDLEALRKHHETITALSSEVDVVLAKIQEILNTGKGNNSIYYIQRNYLLYKKKLLEHKNLVLAALASDSEDNENSWASKKNVLIMNLNQMQVSFQENNPIVDEIIAILKTDIIEPVNDNRLAYLEEQLKLKQDQLAQKKSCQSDFKNIKAISTQSSTIKQLEELEEIKKSRVLTEKEKTLCSGVADKMKQETMKILSRLDSLWNCKAGLRELEDKVAELIEQTRKIKVKGSSFKENKDKLENLKIQWLTTSSEIKSEKIKLMDKSLADLKFSSSGLKDAIRSNKDELLSNEQELRNLQLRLPSGPNPTGDSSELQELVARLRSAKSKLCVEQERYQSLATRLNKRLLEQEQSISNWEATKEQYEKIKSQLEQNLIDFQKTKEDLQLWLTRSD